MTYSNEPSAKYTMCDPSYNESSKHILMYDTLYDEPSAKRTLMYNDPLFSILPSHIQFMIIQNMNFVDAYLLSIKIPHISNIVNNIKWSSIDYNNDTKNKMLIKAFESSNINLIEKLFSYVKYTDINNIYINNAIFNKIIEICYNNNFIKGIDFLTGMKNNHYINFKNHVNDNYQLILQYINSNNIEPRKVLLDLIISNNNIKLLNYIINTNDHDLIMYFNDYKNKLFTSLNKTTMIKRIKYRLLSLSKSSDSANFYYNNINTLIKKNCVM